MTLSDWLAHCEQLQPKNIDMGLERVRAVAERMQIRFACPVITVAGTNGNIVDATIIGAPSSTKNADKARDPEMHQTRKGQQWYFGMKLHIGVELLHGNEQRMYGDSAYASQTELIASKAPKAR